MRGLISPILVTLLLISVAAGAYVATDQFLAAAYAPRPSISGAELTPGETGPPLASRLVIVIIDGLRSDALSVMPFTDELWARSASAIVNLPPPTYAEAGWYTLLTGATPELLGLPLLPDPAQPFPSLPVGSLLALNAAAGRTCAVALHATWRSLLPADWCAAQLFVPGEDATADQQIADGARDMERGRPALMLVHFSQLKTVGQTYGATDVRYRQSAQALDGMVRQVVEPALADGAAVAILSSHGLSKRGDTGGAEAAVVRVPFFLMGPGIIAGGYGSLNGVDVAPTLAALIGLPVPTLAQGRVRYDLLAADQSWQTGRQLRMATQRVQLAQRYLATWGASSEELSRLSEMIAQAERAFQGGDAQAAWQKADAALQMADEVMQQAKHARLTRERLPRLLLAVAALGLSGVLWLLWRRRYRLPVLGAALLGWLSTHLAFLIGGGRYSLSSASQIETFLLTTLWQAGLGIGLATMAPILWRIWQRNAQWPSPAHDLLSTAWAMMSAWGIPVAIGYWRHGAAPVSHLPNVTLAFWHLWGLTQLWAIPLFAVPIAWLLGGLYALLGHRGELSRARAPG